ncbi:MAG TPA: hypothetical protein PLP19_00595 [bacterium]|nr:hypothetical protein [bacterium]HPN41962.1 hypothetical protein [bacterium]
MPHTEIEKVLRFGMTGVMVNMAGVLLSGPLGLLVVTQTHPQPAWQDARLFLEYYHPVQTLPFFAGIALVLGYVMMIAAIHLVAAKPQRPLTLTAAMLTAAFATLIFFNYINQTTFVPALVKNYQPDYDPLIAAFSFSNPNSLCWAIEMWGYALLGLATWFAAPVFKRTKCEKITAWLMISNGVISIAGVVFVSGNLAWVFTPAGLASYAVWNALVFVMAVFIYISFRQRATALQAENNSTRPATPPENN